ncbi:hypothetical protein M885DRAFT_471630 [Pelagophyceae sp. CCMP2097]|nr:hypothetical protein M885DRAFT_471630 [Pelagophyceae sp. CCMP2097]|mmetsp:Transcript_16739/g.56555  ORF Transcript_16739/g.56555 Transcript_16739/m.56555 type:complete len:289 (+) Transcript_16739:52-918(+)|eukprot:CAMPEP_0184097716 /NCGR_PEP_ID=MMETSP0974-20121125/10942_1 /TAXON_ID=483370 /ORGANISM="non described non described, Strain CCMP2097" /LENGTH=288 /DNA_ID=CAMNT_0026400585 /DNA_START=47 /DNA_END=913 /DNA_ORIENTATION=+
MGCLPAVGNALTAFTLLVADVVVSPVTFIFRGIVDGIDYVCGSGKNTSRAKVPWAPQRFATEPIYVKDGLIPGELDVDAMLKKSDCAYAPEDLIMRTKKVIATEFGTAEGCSPDDLLAADFQFVAPIVGPLGREEFLRAFGSFKVKDAIPDSKDNSWFTVDPLEPNRVWWFSRLTATHTGPLNFGGSVIPGEGKEIRMPPQASSMLFDADGKVYTMTVGYTMDKRIGNTQGLGAVFGILSAIGKSLPFPEAQKLYTPSLRFEAFERVAKTVEECGFDPNTQQAIPAKE